MKLHEIVVDGSREEKMSAIKDHAGKKVILEDDHIGWIYGNLVEGKTEITTYHIKRADGRGENVLHYHDLKGLLVFE